MCKSESFGTEGAEKSRFSRRERMAERPACTPVSDSKGGRGEKAKGVGAAGGESRLHKSPRFKRTEGDKKPSGWEQSGGLKGPAAHESENF